MIRNTGPENQNQLKFIAFLPGARPLNSMGGIETAKSSIQLNICNMLQKQTENTNRSKEQPCSISQACKWLYTGFPTWLFLSPLHTQVPQEQTLASCWVNPVTHGIYPELRVLLAHKCCSRNRVPAHPDPKRGLYSAAYFLCASENLNKSKSFL